MKKRLLRIFVGLVVLLLLLALALQIVLWTDLPRNWVLSAIQQKLQLRMDADSLSTGWSGQTELVNVHASLPLAQESFLQTRSLRVRHTGLIPLIFGRSLTVKSIEIDSPTLLVRQLPDGRWNLQEVAELISRATGGKTADTQPKPSGVPQMPRVAVNNATLRLVDRIGKQATLAPLTITGTPTGPLVWHIDAQVPGQIHIQGDVAPGGAWEHQLDIQLARLLPLVKPFLDNPSQATLDTLAGFEFDARWSGRIDGTPTGRLEIRKLPLAGYQTTGPLNVAFADGAATLSPIAVEVRSPVPTVPPIRAGGGQIVIEAKAIQAHTLALAVAGGEVRANANLTFASGEARLDASWNKLILPRGTTHSGTLSASLRQPWPNQPAIDATLTTTGQFGAADTWEGQLVLSGNGPYWDQIQWKLSAPKLTYTQAKQVIDLSNISANGATRGQLVTLDSLSIPPGSLYGNFKRGSLAGRGQYNLASGAWFLYVNGGKWPVRPNSTTPADFFVNAHGAADSIHLDQFFLEGGGMQVSAYGDIFLRQKDMPVQLHIHAWYPPVEYTWHEQGGDPADDVKFQGKFSSELHLTESAWPTNLKITGALYAQDFVIKNHPVGNVVLRLEGFADEQRIHLDTTRLKLFNGTWDLSTDYRFENRLTRLSIALNEMSLAQLDNFAAPPPNLRGDFQGRWVIKLPDFNPSLMEMEGSYRISKLAHVNPLPATQPTSRPADLAEAITAAYVQPSASTPRTTPRAATQPRTTTGPDIEQNVARATTRPADIRPLADLIEGKMAAANGRITFDPILLERKDGRGQFKASFPITAPRQLRLEGSVAAWPLDLLDTENNTVLNVLLWAQTGVDLDLKNLTASGPVNLQTTVAIKDQTVASIQVDSAMKQRRLDLKRLSGDIMGGRLSGDGYLYLDNPYQSAGRFEWKSLDATRITRLYPIVKGLDGRYSGQITFAPTPPEAYPRATGPFAISGQVISEGGRLHGMQIGDLRFVAFADYQRVVLENLDWNIAGGRLSGWARYTRYDDNPFVHVRLGAQNLSLDQIVLAARPPDQAHEEMPGLIQAEITAAGNPFTDAGRRAASGDIRARITHSDLVNVDVINALYTIMSVQFGPPVPTGRGFVQARLEGERLEIPAARYVNRGVDVWANLTVLDVFKGTDSPIQGTAAGSARPLKDLKLPFMADVDQLLKALQGGLATVEVTGSVRDPAPRVIPFAQSGDTFRRFMLGEIKNETRGTAGR